MTTEPNPTGETPAAAQAAAPEPTQTQAAPAAEEVWEDGKPFDPERAKKTIQSLRGEVKLSKQEKAELEQYRQEKAKRDEAEMTELQKAQKKAEEAEAQNAKLQADILRRDVIAETGLPAAFAERLKGSTKDELMADAQELLKILPKQKVNPTINPTNPSNGEQVETDAQKRARLFGPQGSTLFDPESIKQKGGGVVWTK